MQGTSEWQWVARGVYGALLVLAGALLATGQPGAALFPAAAGLALDPFDPRMRWSARARWQHGWLIAHLALVLVLVVAAFR